MKITPIEQQISYTGKVPIYKKAHVISNPKNNKKNILKHIAGVTEDTCHFNKVDRSLDPDFVRSLLKIECKTTIMTYDEIKDRVLEAKGFSQPWKLGWIIGYTGDMAIDAISGNIMINTDSPANKEVFIAGLYHELDHMEKYIKLYKALGEEKFIKILYKLAKKQNPKSSLNDIKKAFNKQFYESMSKDVTLKGFDVQKYQLALEKYEHGGWNWSYFNAYYNNPLEDDAYKIQSEVQTVIGLPSETSADEFSRYNTTFINLMIHGGVPKNEWLKTIDNMILLSFVKFAEENPDNIEKFMNIYNQIIYKKTKPSSKDIDYFKKILNKIPKVQRNKYVFEQIESWLREGKYTVRDVLKDI